MIIDLLKIVICHSKLFNNQGVIRPGLFWWYTQNSSKFVLQRGYSNMSNEFNEWIMIPCGIKSSILMHSWYMSWIVMVQTCQIPGQDSVISMESAPDQSVHLSATIAFTSLVYCKTWLYRCISKFEAWTLQVESGIWIRNLQGGWSLKLNWFPSSKASNPSKVLSDIFPTSAQGKNHLVLVTSKVGMFQNDPKWAISKMTTSFWTIASRSMS